MSKQSPGVAAASTGRGSRVAAEERRQQVALLGLGRRARRRAGALDVDHHQRQLDHHRQPEGLLLQDEAGAAETVNGELPGEGRADRRADGGDLVLGLEGLDAEVAEARHLVEHVAGRRDRIGAEKDGRPSGRGGDDAPGQCRVARDVAVGARLDLGRGAPTKETGKSSVVSPKCMPARSVRTFASSTSPLNLFREPTLGGSIGRP